MAAMHRNRAIMKRISCWAAVAAMASSAFAGVRIETTTRDIATKVAQGEPQVMQVQDGKILATRGSNHRMILGNEVIIMLDDKHRTYREMDQESLKRMADQAGAAMAQMQEKMKNLSPEQRAMMEKAMGKHIPGGMGAQASNDTYAAQDTGRSDTVDGRVCRLWQTTRNGAPLEELCVVPYASLPGREDLEKALRTMADAFEDLSRAMPGIDKAMKARLAVNGYPVRVRRYDAQGALRKTETVLTKWSEEALPAAVFEVPPGYTKMGTVPIS
jgi:hypothetical protein